MVVGATSRPDLVDDLVLGATGLRLRVDVPLPDHDDRAAILAAVLAARPAGARLTEDELTALAKRSDGLTPGDLVLAADLALRSGRPLADALTDELDSLSREAHA